MTNLGLDGKRVIVTGAAGGLGRAFSYAFARTVSAAGAQVLVADVNAAGMAETVAQIGAQGGKAFAAEVDVTSAQSCAAMANQAAHQMAGLDVLVNNAAL